MKQQQTYSGNICQMLWRSSVTFDVCCRRLEPSVSKFDTGLKRRGTVPEKCGIRGYYCNYSSCEKAQWHADSETHGQEVETVSEKRKKRNASLKAGDVIDRSLRSIFHRDG
jgi:hypothetical protein